MSNCKYCNAELSMTYTVSISNKASIPSDIYHADLCNDCAKAVVNALQLLDRLIPKDSAKAGSGVADALAATSEELNSDKWECTAIKQPDNGGYYLCYISNSGYYQVLEWYCGNWYKPGQSGSIRDQASIMWLPEFPKCPADK